MDKKYRLKEGAIKNLKTTDLKDHAFTNEEVNILNNWTYIGMFLFESKTSLTLSEKFNKKEKMLTMEDVIMSHGMFRNAILSYAKCFSSSGRDRISLDASEIFSIRKDLRSIHDQMMSIRNTFIAHNSDNEIDLAIMVTLDTEEEIELAQTYHLLTPINEFKNFHEAIDYCQQMVIEKFNKKADKIQDRIGKLITFR